MTIKLNEGERVTLMIVLGMAMATAVQVDRTLDEGMCQRIRQVIGKLSPDSYWGLPPEDNQT